MTIAPHNNRAQLLASYVSGVVSGNKRMIVEALEALAKQLDIRQLHVQQAIVQYRDSLTGQPSEDEFYDLVAFIGDFTADFNESRIDVTVVDSEKLAAWQSRIAAPSHPVRRHVMLLLIEAAVARGLLSGIGCVNDWLSFADGSELLGEWLLSRQGGVTQVFVDTTNKPLPLTTGLRSITAWQELPARVRNPMIRGGAVYLGDIIDRPRHQVMWRPWLGRKAMSDLGVFLDRVGYKFWDDESDMPACVAEFLEWRKSKSTGAE